MWRDNIRGRTTREPPPVGFAEGRGAAAAIGYSAGALSLPTPISVLSTYFS
jgi:hypothetical protein